MDASPTRAPWFSILTHFREACCLDLSRRERGHGGDAGGAILPSLAHTGCPSDRPGGQLSGTSRAMSAPLLGFQQNQRRHHTQVPAVISAPPSRRDPASRQDQGPCPRRLREPLPNCPLQRPHAGRCRLQGGLAKLRCRGAAITVGTWPFPSTGSLASA